MRALPPCFQIPIHGHSLKQITEVEAAWHWPAAWRIKRKKNKNYTGRGVLTLDPIKLDGTKPYDRAVFLEMKLDQVSALLVTGSTPLLQA